MPKDFIKKYIPNKETIQANKYLKIFGSYLHSPSLWSLNRRNTPRAFSIGLFMAYVPMPFQMVPAAALAILFRANIPLSMALVWFSNPITMPPLFFFAYKIGAYILDIPPTGFNFEISWEWLVGGLLDIWQPFLLGCFICGSFLAITSNITIRLLWRYSLVNAFKKRQANRKAKQEQQAKLGND